MRNGSASAGEFTTVCIRVYALFYLSFVQSCQEFGARSERIREDPRVAFGALSASSRLLLEQSQGILPGFVLLEIFVLRLTISHRRYPSQDST